MLFTATEEIWQSSSLGFSLCSLLTHGAADALLLHGSEALRETYLTKLVTGEWAGTMNLTEPQAGSDLAALINYPWKYIFNLDDRTGELYNLIADPGERANLARTAKPRAPRPASPCSN